MAAARKAPSFDSPATGTQEEHGPTIVVARSATRSEADALGNERRIMTTDADVAHTTVPLAEPLAGAGTVSALRETPWISHAVVAGDRRSYLVALLTLDQDEAPRLAQELGIPADLASMSVDERVRAALQSDVDTVNAR
jgi:hypothetical protein